MVDLNSDKKESKTLTIVNNSAINMPSLIDQTKSLRN